MRILGVILIILGGLALAYKGITYTRDEEILKVGPIQATAKKEETIPISPVVGGVVLAAGVLLVVVGGRKR